MTKQHDLKSRIRARMEKTGERYVVARSHILGLTEPGDTDRAYTFRPGLCRDTAAATNALRAVWGAGPAPDEDLITGLTGGIGFLYIVFEYADTPPLLSVLTRFDSAADQFLFAALPRLSPAPAVTETTSPKKAQANLDAALDAGVALCVVDLVTIATTPMKGLQPGMAPTVVAVTGRDGDDYVLDTGLGRSVPMSPEKLAQARSAYAKGKHRTATLSRGAAWTIAPKAIDDAVDACLDRYDNAPYKGFASNFGFAGMEKWAAMLESPKDPKGWKRLFAEGPRAALGLRRAYQGLTCEMTSPGAGRRAYARFLTQAASRCKNPAYAKAATAYGKAADAWKAIALAISECGVREVKTGCDLLDAYARMLDEGDPKASSVASDLEYSGASCALTRDQASALFDDLAAKVRQATQAERDAAAALRQARASH